MDISLDQARRRAKELLKEARAGRTTLREDRAPRLADAQHRVATDLGFSSWPRLVEHVETVQGTREERRARLLDRALNGRGDRAEALLAADPGLLGSSLAVGIVTGDPAAIEACDVRAPVEDTGKAPLLLLTQSTFLHPSNSRAPQCVAAVARLLQRGADPNGTFTNEYGEMSAVYGAAGVARNPEATRLLLQAGADPDDGESVYHASEVDDTSCLELLLAHGATVKGTNAVGMALAAHHRHVLQVLLERGDLGPEDEELRPRLLHTNNVESARLLLAHGADVNARDQHGLTPYDHAIRMGHDALAQLLADSGGAHDPDPVCAWLGEVLKGRQPGPPPGKLRWSDAELLPRWASAGDDEKVARLVAAGVPIDSPGVDGGSGLCYAGLWGRPRTVQLLIELGANVTDVHGLGTPIGWVCWGSRHVDRDRERTAEYIRCAQLMLAAGAVPNAAQVEEAADELSVLLDSGPA